MSNEKIKAAEQRIKEIAEKAGVRQSEIYALVNQAMIADMQHTEKMLKFRQYQYQDKEMNLMEQKQRNAEMDGILLSFKLRRKVRWINLMDWIGNIPAKVKSWFGKKSKPVDAVAHPKPLNG
jgi:hypothetical protein